MVEGFGLLKSTRRRWKKQQSQQQDKQPLNINTNPTDVDDAASLISIVDDRLYQGYHPEADPFSMARVQSRSFQPNGTSSTIKKDSSSTKITKLISKSSKGAEKSLSSSCHSPIKSRSNHRRLAFPSNSLPDETSEDIGVYAQRDVIIGPHPLYNFLQETTQHQQQKDKSHTIQSTLLRKNVNHSTESGVPKSTSQGAPKVEESYMSAPVNPTKHDDSCTIVTTGAATIATATTTTSIAANNNITCLLDMLTSMCVAVSPIAVQKVHAVSTFNNCTPSTLLRQRIKAIQSDDEDDCTIPPVQSHRRRHKIAQSACTQSIEQCERDQSPPKEEDDDEYRQDNCSSVRNAYDYHQNSQQQRVTIVPGRSPVPTDQNTGRPVVSSAAVVTSVAVYPIARYSDRLNSTELVERRRKSLQKFLTFQPVVPPEDEQSNLLLSNTNSNLS